MDPVSLVVAALVAGASAGLTGVASAAVSEAYAGLKRVAGGLLSVRRAGSEAVLDRDQVVEPAVWEGELVPVLAETGVGRDEQVVAAAREVLALVDPAGSAAGKYTLDLRGAQGVQVGNHNTQHNTF